MYILICIYVQHTIKKKSNVLYTLFPTRAFCWNGRFVNSPTHSISIRNKFISPQSPSSIRFSPWFVMNCSMNVFVWANASLYDSQSIHKYMYTNKYIQLNSLSYLLLNFRRKRGGWTNDYALLAPPLQPPTIIIITSNGRMDVHCTWTYLTAHIDGMLLVIFKSDHFAIIQYDTQHAMHVTSALIHKLISYTDISDNK